MLYLLWRRPLQRRPPRCRGLLPRAPPHLRADRFDLGALDRTVPTRADMGSRTLNIGEERAENVERRGPPRSHTFVPLPIMPISRLLQFPRYLSGVPIPLSTLSWRRGPRVLPEHLLLVRYSTTYLHFQGKIICWLTLFRTCELLVVGTGLWVGTNRQVRGLDIFSRKQDTG